MKKVEKFKLQKNHKILIITAAVLVLLVAAYFVIGAIASYLKKKNQTEAETPYYNEALGELLYLGNAIAYSPIEERDILSILISNEEGVFDLTRYPDDNGYFWIGYDDGNGVKNMAQYIPPIMDVEGDFDYESFYAMETGDGFGMIYMLTYLCSSISSPLISERIELPDGQDANSIEKRELLLKDYGLDDESAVSIAFAYNKRDKDDKVSGRESHLITLGDRALNDSGFYYMVDDRNVIYYTKSNYFEYALKGCESFIKGSLVAPGLESDKTLEPYLTSDFKEWVLEQHKKGKDDQIGPIVTDNSTVIANGTIISTGVSGGLVTEENQKLTFDLGTLSGVDGFDRLKAALVGKEVGFDYSSQGLIFTLVSDAWDSENRLIAFGEESSVDYSYTLISIDSILTDTDEITLEGTPVSDNKLLKVTYTRSIAGEDDGKQYCAVIDITDEIFGSVRGELEASCLGELATPITVDVAYTEENASVYDVEIVLNEVVAIYDTNGAETSVVTNKSLVTISYTESVNGQDKMKRVISLDMSKISDGSKWAPARDAILGESKGLINEVIYEKTEYYEVFRDFHTYSIDDIEYFVTEELIVSFNFCKVADRDPYYGDTYYENTLKSENELYGLNASTCEEVVKILGGTGESASSSLGLSGTTVALGLTLENMEKYGLYAYKIYFELPRAIYDKDTLVDEENKGEGSENFDSFVNYDWVSTLGFTLYVSEEDPVKGTRYVGSDMYDLIAEVDSALFEFLKFDFAEFWARRNMVLMKISNVDEFKIELNMDDVYGDYTFDFGMEKVWGGYIDGKFVTDGEYFTGATELEKLYINISEGEGAMESELQKYLAEKGVDEVSATQLYAAVRNNGVAQYEPGSIDSYGTDNFKLAFEKLQLTRYQGLLTDEEKEKVASSPLVMRMHLKVVGQSDYYTYDFYRIDDRKIAVSLYKTNSEGNKSKDGVMDFYLSTFAFKKLVYGFTDVINCVDIDIEEGYPH